MKPESEAALADLIRGANDPLRIAGGGTRAVGSGEAGQTVETSGLSGVVFYDPGALTMVAKAGTPLREIEETLQAERQRLAFEPADWRSALGTEGTPTIGGVVAANVSGPRRVQTGACRDHMLGLRFVDGTGNIVKNGGRVMKNVTGYDLVKLLTGSWGTLGVLTEVSFKVLAQPQSEATVAVRGLSAREGVAHLSAALGSPFDVTGAAHAEPGTLEDDAITLVRVEGLEHSVQYRAGALQSEQMRGGEILRDTQSAALWTQVRDVAPLAGAKTLWRVSVSPGNGPRLLSTLEEAGHHPKALLDWGGGLVWLGFTAPDVAAQAQAIRAFTRQNGGHATLFRGLEGAAPAVPTFEPENPVLAKISSDLRAQFDPRGILNPGLMG